MPSRGEIDRLGEALRRGAVTGSDQVHDALTGYDAYRQLVAQALDEVVSRIEEILPDMEISSRMKTPDSVIAKLRRTPQMRLSRMQDVVGCRFVVATLNDQDVAVSSLAGAFPTGRVDDIRQEPHSGYRAVHVIVKATSGDSVEVQVRTTLQQKWAELSEKVAYAMGMEVKYGGGPEAIRTMLDEMASEAAELDSLKVVAEWSENLKQVETRFLNRCAAIITLAEGPR